jgi:hypothetical protein
MCQPVSHPPRRPILLLSLVLGLVCESLTSLRGQTSNRVWFVSYNGQPTPSSDVSVQTVATDGSANTLPAGAATYFVSQTNFSSLNSPYDVAVDPAMGKAYVLDNNVENGTPEYIYSFNLAGTPVQIAASATVLYTMPVPAADVTANTYPLITGLALDPVNHFLYFNQVDFTTGTNSCIGRLDLASSIKSDLYSTNNGNPVLHAYNVGQIPGQGPIGLDTTNIYLGAINNRTGNSGVYVAPRDGGGSFAEIVGVSTNDVNFTNGLVSGVASDPADHFVYYLTFNGGYFNGSFNLGQNAVWVYNTVAHSKAKIVSGYPGYPENLAVDPANGRYYFTLGLDGTQYPPGTNYQAIYTSNLGTTYVPTLLYTPGLSGLDVAGGLNAGYVALQGIYVEDAPALGAFSTAIYLTGGAAVTLSPGLVPSDPSSTALIGATVAVNGGIFPGDGDTLAAVTNGTTIAATYNASTETLTLSGSDSLTNYQQVLRTVAFSSSNVDPTHGGAYPTRGITWTVTDGVLTSPVATSSVTLVAAPAPAANRISFVVTAGNWILLYTGTSGQNYVVQFAASLPGPWSDLSPVLTANSAGLIAYNGLSQPRFGNRFYRVRTAP